MNTVYLVLNLEKFLLQLLAVTSNKIKNFQKEDFLFEFKMKKFIK